MDVFAARAAVFLSVCVFGALAVGLSGKIRTAKKAALPAGAAAPAYILALVVVSAVAMLYLIRQYPAFIGVMVAVVLGLGTAVSLGGWDRRLSLPFGVLVTALFLLSNLSVSALSVFLRGAATFISSLCIGVYFSRLVGYRSLATASVLLAGYDFVAVFVTRHMGELNEAGRNILPLVAVPYVKGGLLILPGTGIGSGDLVILAALIAGAHGGYGKKAGYSAAAGAVLGFALTFVVMAALGIWLAPGLPGIVFGGIAGTWAGRKLK
jgi:hypothetical protein